MANRTGWKEVRSFSFALENMEHNDSIIVSSLFGLGVGINRVDPLSLSL